MQEMQKESTRKRNTQFFKDCEKIRSLYLYTKKLGAPVYKLEAFLNNYYGTIIKTLLSTRTRDEKTLEATRNLYKKAKNFKQLAKLSIKEIEQAIKPTGFYKVKAKHLKQTAQILSKQKIPPEKIQELPGIGPKTANIILAKLYHKKVISVDTHVHRITQRITGIKTRNPKETQKLLEKLVPKKCRDIVNPALVGLGQTICKPLKPKCTQCPIKEYCYYYLNLRKSQ